MAVYIPDPHNQETDPAHHESDQHQITGADQDAPQDGPPEGADHPGVMTVHHHAIVAAFHVIDDQRHDTEDAGDSAEEMQDIRHDGNPVAWLFSVMKLTPFINAYVVIRLASGNSSRTRRF